MAWFMALLIVSVFQDGRAATTFTVTNNCSFTVWPGALSNAGDAALSTTGLVLEPGESKGVDAPAGWSGRFWGRTLCAANADGRFGCGSGDCGSGVVECSGGGAEPPATLAEFTLGGGSAAEDYYDVSLVDGYNLPVAVAPRSEGCRATGCEADVNGVCPAELKVLLVAGGGEEGRGGGGVACRSACQAFGTPEYCCSGAYGSPDTCRPSAYSEVFKRACPGAYSYAYDDATSIFTCAGATEYVITFCPSAATAAAAAGSSQKSSGQYPDAGRQPSMVILGDDFSKANPSNSHAHLTIRIAFLIPLWVSLISSINQNRRRHMNMRRIGNLELAATS